MKNRSNTNRTLGWKYAGALLAMLLFAMPVKLQAQQFADITVSWVGSNFNEQCCTDQGLDCGFDIFPHGDPDPRWQLRAYIAGDPAPGYSIQKRDNAGCPGNTNFNVPQFSRSNVCGTLLVVQTASWEEDGFLSCGSDDTFDPGCLIDADDDYSANIDFYNYQTGVPQGAPSNRSFNDGNRGFTLQIEWTAAGPSAPLVQVPAATCVNSSARLIVTSALTVPSHQFRWYSNAGLTVQVGTGATFNTPPLTGNTSYWVAEVDPVGGCKGQSNRVDLTPLAAVAAPDVSTTSLSACVGSVYTLTATSNEANSLGVFNWWSDLDINGVPTGLLFSGSPFQYTATASTTIYCTEELNGCQSAPVAIAINAFATPNDPVADDYNPACWDGPATLIATTDVTNSIEWYADPAGLNLLGTGTSFQTDELTQPTWFYMASRDNSSGCLSNIVPILAEVTPQFEAPAVDNIQVCVGQNTVTLKAHVSFSTDLLYDLQDRATFDSVIIRFTYNPDYPSSFPILGYAPTLIVPSTPGNGIWDADAEVTIPISGALYDFSVPGSYSISAVAQNYWNGPLGLFGCESAFGAATLLCSETPAAPDADGVTICEGQSANLVATGEYGATFTWYDENDLGHAVQVGAEYNTPVLTTTTSYWVTQTLNGCESPSTEVIVTVNPPADLPFGVSDYTICIGQTIPAGEGLEATCSDAGGGGNAVANIAGTATFPILVGPDAGEGGTASFDATAIPAGSTVTKVTVSATLIHTWIGDISMELVSPSATSVFVHDQNGGADNFGTGGPPPTTPAAYTWDDAAGAPIINQPGDFNQISGSYIPVEALSGFNGEDPNGIWTLNVLDNFDFDGGSMTAASLHIEYNLPANAGSLTWWDDETGGTQVGSGTPFVPAGYETFTPGSYTYWAQCDDLSNCSNRRVAVTFTVLPEIPAPIVRGDLEVCEGFSATLTVANPSNTVEWYTDPSLSTIVHVGPVYTTPPLSTTTTYYVVNNNGVCLSEPTEWTVTVNPSPEMPDVFTNIQWSDGYGNLAVCDGENIELDIILDDPANQLAFIYTESEPESLDADWLFVTDEFIDITTSSDMIYYIRSYDFNTGCFSKPVPIYINVYPRPRTPDVRGATVCVGESATIFADLSTLFDNAPPYQSYNIYWAEGDDVGTIIEIHPVNTSSVITNDSLIVGPFNTPGLYSYQVVVSNELGDPVGFCYSYPAVVTVTVLERPEAPIVRPAEVCEGEDVVLVALCDGDVRWYSDAGLTNLVHVGSEFPVFGATSTTTYYVTCKNGSCESEAAEALLTVNAKPEAPTPDQIAYMTCFDESTELFAANTNGDPILWFEDPAGLVEWSTDSSGSFFTPEITQPAIYYVAAVDPVTGCRSDIVPVQVFPTPKFEHPRVDDIEVCANGDSVTLIAHVSFPRDLATDFFDYFTFLNAIVRFVNTDNQLLVFGDAPVALDPFNDIWEGVATLTIPAVGADWDFTVPGTYDIGARTANFWYDLFADELLECSSDYGTGSVVVLPRPVPPVVSNTSPVCEGGNVTVSAEPIPGGIYNWTGPNGFSSNAQQFTLYNVTLAQAGVYTLVVTDLNGCQSDDATTEVIVNPLPDPDTVYATPNPLCEHETLTLIAEIDNPDAYTFQWNGPNGYSASGATVVINDVDEIDNQGFYSVVITDTLTGCASLHVILVEINTFPDKLIADNDGPVCEGGTINLNVTNVFGATYEWSGPLGYSANGQHQTLTDVTPDMSGTYTVVVTLPGGCVDSASTEVIVWPNPVADAGPDDTTYQDDPIVLNGSGGTTYQWVPNTYLDHDNIPNPIFNSPDVGTFPIVLTVWEDDHGCSDKDTVVIEVLPKLDLQIPDLITPNGDGLNDNWIIKYLENIRDPYTLDIYARGGAKVYSTTAYANDWNGTYDGKQLPDGGYWFVLAIEGGKTYKGSVTIKR